MSMNPFDEIAVEEAVRLKEKGAATEVIAVSCVFSSARRRCAPRWRSGRIRSILVSTDTELQPLAVAKLLKALIDKEQPASSSSASRPSTTTATRPGRCWPPLADLPQATFASKVEIADGAAQVTREIDGGLETLKITLPAIVTTDLRLNEPRYVTLPNIMKAKKKTMDIVKPEELGVDIKAHLKTLKVSEPPKRSAGIKVPDVATLVAKLKNEAKVI
jgi:electron transfer flavoprotein beta subunit